MQHNAHQHNSQQKLDIQAAPTRLRVSQSAFVESEIMTYLTSTRRFPIKQVALIATTLFLTTSLPVFSHAQGIPSLPGLNKPYTSTASTQHPAAAIAMPAVKTTEPWTQPAVAKPLTLQTKTAPPPAEFATPSPSSSSNVYKRSVPSTPAASTTTTPANTPAITISPASATSSATQPAIVKLSPAPASAYPSGVAPTASTTTAPTPSTTTTGSASTPTTSSTTLAKAAPATTKAKTPTKGTPAIKSPVTKTTSKSPVAKTPTKYETTKEQSATAIPASAIASNYDLLRSIPLDIDEYEATKSFPPHFTSSDQVLKAIDSTPVLLVHMEVFRRSFHDLPASERTKVLAALQQRRKQNETDLATGFDHGYAQLVYEHNKTGLFFLRKANDKFQTQFTALAYGMAQVEADLTLENSTPEEMTTRKLDAMFQLGDAVKRDAANHQSGFWPSFVRVVQAMKPLTAYGSFPRRDFSVLYVPSLRPGMLKTAQNTATATPTEASASTSTSTEGDIAPTALLQTSTGNHSCSPQATEAVDVLPANAKMTAGRSAVFAGKSYTIQSFDAEVPGQKRVRLLDSTSKPVLSFHTYASLESIVEDIDGDGVPEIVARQYAQSPFEPIIVYRSTPCGFQQDQKVSSFFE